MLRAAAALLPATGADSACHPKGVEISLDTARISASATWAGWASHKASYAVIAFQFFARWSAVRHASA